MLEEQDAPILHSESTHQVTYTIPRSQSEHLGVSDGTFVGR